MKLYSSPISPYAARCRIQIAHKGLPVEVIPPPGGMSSVEVRAKNPAGRIPVLDLGEQAIAESWAIMNYLETQHPDTPMRPADAFAVAKQEELVRFVDIYLAPAMFPLFRALRGGVSEDETKLAVAGLGQQLGVLDQLLSQPAEPSNNGMPLTLADAAMLPVIWYARILARHYGEPDCLAANPQVASWWSAAEQQPAVKAVLVEMESALKQAIPPLFP